MQIPMKLIDGAIVDERLVRVRRYVPRAASPSDGSLGVFVLVVEYEEGWGSAIRDGVEALEVRDGWRFDDLRDRDGCG